MQNNDTTIKLVEHLTAVLRYAENQTCLHEDTYRGGAIWEICDACGKKWADDEGGKPENASELPKVLIEAEDFLQSLQDGETAAEVADEVAHNTSDDKIIAALVRAHSNTCKLIANLPVWCFKARRELVQQLADITCAIDDFARKAYIPEPTPGMYTQYTSTYDPCKK